MGRSYQFPFRLPEIKIFSIHVTFSTLHILTRKKPLFSFRKHKKNLSEAELIVLAKEDSHYFGELYDRYFERIFRFVFKRLGGNEEVAGDLTQQTFRQ